MRLLMLLLLTGCPSSPIEVLPSDTDLDTSSSDHNEFSLGVPPLTIGITEGNKGKMMMIIFHEFKKISFQLRC